MLHIRGRVRSCLNYRTGPHLKVLSTRSHVNSPLISLSVEGYKGIFYLQNLGGGPVTNKTKCRQFLVL